jgi:hypothetical protein
MMLAMQVGKNQFDYPTPKAGSKAPSGKNVISQSLPASKSISSTYSSSNTVDKIPGDIRSLFADRKKRKMRLNRKFKGRFRLKKKRK